LTARRSPAVHPAVPIDVLTVASWFPGADDHVRGRFIADQVEAVAATSRCRVAVITFVPARLTGGARTRSRQAATIAALQGEAVRTGDPLAASWSDRTPQVPLVRLTIPVGVTRETGAAHEAIHRRNALVPLAHRLRSIEIRAPAGDGRASAPSRPRPGIVHAHTGFPDGAAAVGLAASLGWPLIITEHASFLDAIWSEPARRAEYERAIAAADRFLAVSEVLARQVRSAFPDHAGKVEVVPNAVPLDLFEAAPLAARRSDELLFVGTLKASKGIETLLRAVAIARDGRPSIRLRLVGDAPDETIAARWRELVSQVGLGGAVSFEPAADRSGVAAAMARASVFVHPSPRETFGVVAVEALASGTPVVAVDSGGVTEILGADPARVGALVPPDDPQLLARAIGETLARRPEFDPDTVRSIVADRFAAPRVAERLVDIYTATVRTSRLVPSGIDFERVLQAADSTIPPRRVVVVALDRERAARVVAVAGPGVRSRVTVLTEAEPSSVPVSGVANVERVEAGLAAELRRPRSGARPATGTGARLGGVARGSIRSLRRAVGRDAGSEASLRSVRAALDRLVSPSLNGGGEDADGRSGGPGEGPIIVAVDGHDHLAAEPVIRRHRADLLVGSWLRLALPPVEPGPDRPDSVG
jgi:glycosyltransferase involved in cell wall biosynthesis